MARVIAGDDTSFTTLAFGLPNYDNIQYFQDTFNSIDRSRFLDNSFFDRLYNTYERYSSDYALIKARSVLRNSSDYYKGDIIRVLETLEDIQLADSNMQSYIMVNEKVRDLYHKQLCDGYSNSYIDYHPELSGEYHPDWQRVHDGLVTYLEEENFKVNYYYSSITEETKELSIEEQLDILQTWEIVDNLIDKGEDPTSIYGASL